MPARYGGSELPYDIYCDAVHTLARGDASQAWVYMVLADNALKLTSFSKQAQDEVWGKDPRARLSNAVAPVGKGKPVEGGVLWSGRHGFSSGVDHAQWVMCAGHIEHADGRRQGVNVLVPRSDITIVDDWQVMGLSGSGSKTFVVDGAFVPEHRIVDKEASDAGEVPGLEGYDAPVFHMPRGGISTCSYTAVAVGAAEAMLEEYCVTRLRANRAAPSSPNRPARKWSSASRRPRSRPRRGCICLRCARRWRRWSAARP